MKQLLGTQARSTVQPLLCDHHFHVVHVVGRTHFWRAGLRIMRPTHRTSEEGTDQECTLGDDLSVKSAVYGRSFLRSPLLLIAGEVQVSAMTPVVTSRSFRSACSSSCCP
jgi:hypothetical protein